MKFVRNSTIEKPMINRLSCRRSIAGFILCSSLTLATADTLNLGAKSYDGTFDGFEDGRFLFRTAEGREIKEPRSSVRKLNLTEPRQVALTRTSKREPDKLTMTGYENGKFAVKADGKESTIPGMQVRSITVEMDFQAFGAMEQADTPRPVQPIDISGLTARQDLTAEQTAVLKQYQAANGKYNAFLTESSALVEQMDKATGAKREALLNVLRRRKAEEQPVKRDLEISRTALLKAFPDLVQK